jgi:hypothetical protein
VGCVFIRLSLQGLAKLSILGAKAKGTGRASSLALKCETELDKDKGGASLHVSSDQETWRPGITQTLGSKPLSHCIVSKRTALQISAEETQALGLSIGEK